MNKDSVSVVVVGCGNMGSSHARAYHKIDGFELVGLVDAVRDKRETLSKALGGVPTYEDFGSALKELRPKAVAICTYPDTHAPLATQALESGCHVFVEKPLAETVEGARKLSQIARQKNRKVVVGYILRHHPAWAKFVELAQGLGKPLVMRMNLNQQSSGQTWNTHKNLLKSMSPIVDCGVHYVDIMCQMTRTKPVMVSGISARLTDEIGPKSFNYGQLQVTFEDGSVGWYEAGWGPMMSEVAFFVKDVVGPKGCVSIVEPRGQQAAKGSDDIDSHTKTNCLQRHSSDLDSSGRFATKDEFISTLDEPGHDELCVREQQYFLKAIHENVDLTEHLEDAVNSLRIVLAADESARTGRTVKLN